VAADAVFEAVVVAPEFQRGRHFLVRKWPVPELVVEVVRAVLQEDADRPDRSLPDERRVDVSAADVREAADVADDLAELASPRWPGLTKIAIVTGISRLWIRLSKTIGTRCSCSTFTYLWPSWKTMTAAGRDGSYCAGT
jgi:hypothetical protein